MELQAVRGMRDLVGDELWRWTVVEQRIHRLLGDFGYQEIRTPVLENVEVFSRAVGGQTDIVEKQMYLVKDQGDTDLALRPEGTSAFLRALIEQGRHHSGQPQRYYYYLPMFRHERPQKGRLRQFHQFGAELVLDPSPEADAELIVLLDALYKSFGVSRYVIELNSLGSGESRARHRDGLQAFFRPHLSSLCPQCQARFERAPLRILDCKNESCQKLGENAPLVLDFLTEEDRTHFEGVKKQLTSAGVAFTVNGRIVRGLDYYCRTAFEFTSPDLGAQSALGGGGRYDGLSERFGAKPFPAVGWALGMERLLLVLEANGFEFGTAPKPLCYLAPLSEGAFDPLFALSLSLKRQGLWNEMPYTRGKKMSFFLKDAERQGARYLVLVGDDELKQGIAVVKDMKERTQTSVPWKELEPSLLQRKDP